MSQSIRVLIVEDRLDDAELVLRQLRRAGFTVEWERVDNESDYLRCLAGNFDLILSDYAMPQFDGLRALKLLKQSNRNIPFIIISGTIGEDTAVVMMKEGATDYLLKDRLTRLGLAVTHALEQTRLHEQYIKADEELRLFRSLVDQSDDAFEVVDPETARFLDVNDKGCRDLGYTRDELLKLRVFDIDPGVKEQDWVPLMSELRQREVMMIERVHQRRDGTVFPIEINMKMVRLDREYVVVVVRDITERKQAEQAIAREHARFQFIFGSVPVGIAWMERGNPASRIVNPAHARITGVPMDQCRQLDLYRQATPPEDQARQDKLHQQLTAGVIDHYTLEKRYLHPDGSSSWVALTVRFFHDPISDVGQEISTVVDLTGHKEVEANLRESNERFQEISENISEVFWITDPAKNKMLYISPGYERVWGRTCASLYANPHHWLEAIHADDRQRILKASQTKQTLGQYDEIYQIVLPDGTVRWIHDRAFPLCNAEGQVYRVVGVAADITKQHKLEEQFRQAQKMEAIGTLAGGIAHDFNNILAAVSGYAELCKMKAGEKSPLYDYLQAISQASTRATGLVRQILTFSRQQEQQQRLALRLCDVIEESLKLLRATIPSTIEIKFQRPPEMPTILADSTQIHQVMMNLCTNAWHAMRDQLGCLAINVENFHVDEHIAGTHPRLRPGPYVRLTISDTGRGMDQATLERIFEPFFTTKPKGEGTGLGLSVVYGIIESHDGVITVYSKPDVGTIFHLYFPVHAGATEATHAPAGPIPRGQGKHILYVDDEEPLARLGQHTLNQLGYEVEMSCKVVEALEWVRREPGRFDLVITDQTMPGLTGMEFAAELRKIRPDLPIILTTGYSPNLTIERVRQQGIRELLLKPHTIQTLGLAVHHALMPETSR